MRKIINLLMILTFFTLSALSFAQFSKDKEIDVIKTLPRKPHATLDIEVTKIKTESIPANIYEKTKSIYVNFNEVAARQKNKMIIDRDQYELAVVDSLENNYLVNSSGRRKIKSINQLPKLYSYATDKNNEKVIEIKYETLPKDLYLIVKNKNSDRVEGVYALNDLKAAPRITTRTQIMSIVNPIRWDGSAPTIRLYPINGVSGSKPISITTNYTTTDYAQWQPYPGSSYPFDPAGNLPPYYSGGVLALANATGGITPATSGGNNGPYPSFGATTGAGNDYISTVYQFINGQNIYRFGALGGANGLNTKIYLGVQQWNLKDITELFYFTTTSGDTGYINFTLRGDPTTFYDDANATLKRYAASNNVIVKNLTPTDTSQFVIGTVKLNDQNTEMTETSINAPGLRFFGGNSKTSAGFNQVIFAWDNLNNKTVVLQTTIPQVAVNDSYNKSARNYSLNVLKVYNGIYTINSASYPGTTSTMVPGEVYTNSSAPLFRLGVASTSSNPKPFYDNFTFGDLTINTIGGSNNNSSFTITNPIPKGNTSGVGTYVLDGTTRSPSGLPRNTNTLTWTSAGINSNPGYTLYPSKHNIGVWFTDGATTVKAASFTTDSTGKITGATKTGSATVGANQYVFGDFGTGKFSFGINTWDFLVKSGLKMKILHFNQNQNPLTALESDAFGSDTYTINIDVFNPETYYKVDATDSSLIVKNGTQNLTIPLGLNPAINLGKVKTILDDKTLIPNLDFVETGETLTFTSTTNPAHTITGTISLGGVVGDNETGRDLTLNITSNNVVPGETYTLSNADLIKLGNSSPASYYMLKNTLNLILAPSFKNSSFTIANPIPKGNASGVGTYVLDGTTRSPSGLPRNTNTLTWTSAGINSDPGYSLMPLVHNVGVWFTDGATTVKAASFTTDSTGKITGATKTGSATVGANQYVFGDFGTGKFSFGINTWDFLAKSGLQMKILHFNTNQDPLTSLESDAFGVDTYTINIDLFNPETYYRVDTVDTELITKNGTQNLTVPRVLNPKLSLGKVKVILDDKTLIPNLDFIETGETLTFTSTTNPANKVYGTISLGAGDNEAGRELTLNITSGTLNSGEIYSLSNADLIKLGNSNPASYYMLQNTLNLSADTSFIVDYSVEDLDFGSAIKGTEASNEAKTTLNITYSNTLTNPVISYKIRKSPTELETYYNDFKLYPNGDVTQTTNYVVTDIWLGNEVKNPSNNLKRSIDINGKVKDITNANITTTSTLYKNIIELVVTLQ